MVGSKKQLFPAHKAVLAAQSPVFEAMFSHKDSKETQEGRVELIDISGEAVQQMLQYLYTGKVDQVDKYALELFVAADKVIY